MRRCRTGAVIPPRGGEETGICRAPRSPRLENRDLPVWMNRDLPVLDEPRSPRLDELLMRTSGERPGPSRRKGDVNLAARQQAHLLRANGAHPKSQTQGGTPRLSGLTPEGPELSAGLRNPRHPYRATSGRGRL
ncbi:hypothetical protein SKAU_G00035870 [Synaphobranchus kaupii]|uniref:Uncharacterized protein n=1 Tax=Synaphobranchus kaupii TaxID=118154 RepID=A0A9Q1GGA9_SYNKA|nr:hypothetical protein SKAU_G00035870 [Synaphobranchus kaupii]